MSMQSALLKQSVQTELAEFSQDALAWFSGRRSGHMSKWLYSTAQFEGDKACGAEAWTRGVEAAKNGSDYYVFLKERSVIRKSISKLRKIFSKISRLADLGPGSIEAVRDKILPIVSESSYEVGEYTGVDVCADTLTMAKNEITSSKPLIKTRELERDFILDQFSYGEHVPREVAVIFGLTLCNMAIDPRVPELPKEVLSSYFKRLNSHFNSSESWLIVTQDTNQNPESLARAYGALSDHFTRLLYRIQRDLPVSSGFEPEAFKMEVDYFENTQACGLCFVVQKDMSFQIGKEAFELKKNQRLYFHNAFKFDQATFLKAANDGGFDLVQSVEQENNPCVLHVLKTKKRLSFKSSLILRDLKTPFTRSFSRGG